MRPQNRISRSYTQADRDQGSPSSTFMRRNPALRGFKFELDRQHGHELMGFQPPLPANSRIPPQFLIKLDPSSKPIRLPAARKLPGIKESSTQKRKLETLIESQQGENTEATVSQFDVLGRVNQSLKLSEFVRMKELDKSAKKQHFNEFELQREPIKNYRESRGPKIVKNNFLRLGSNTAGKKKRMVTEEKSFERPVKPINIEFEPRTTKERQPKAENELGQIAIMTFASKFPFAKPPPKVVEPDNDNQFLEDYRADR